MAAGRTRLRGSDRMTDLAVGRAGGWYAFRIWVSTLSKVLTPPPMKSMSLWGQQRMGTGSLWRCVIHVWQEGHSGDAFEARVWEGLGPKGDEAACEWRGVPRYVNDGADV